MNQRQPRIRNPKYLAWLRLQPCACCGAAAPCEAAHIRSASPRDGKRAVGMQEKPDDRWALPLKAAHHRRQHSMNELRFWREAGKDPFVMSDFHYMRYVAEHGDTTLQPRARQSIKRITAASQRKPVKARKPRDRRTKIPQRKTAWPKRTMR